MARNPLVRNAHPQASPEATNQPNLGGPVALQPKKKNAMDAVTMPVNGASRIAVVPRMETSSDVMNTIAAMAARSHRRVHRRTNIIKTPAENPVIKAAGNRRAKAFSPNPRKDTAVIQ